MHQGKGVGAEMARKGMHSRNRETSIMTDYISTDCTPYVGGSTNAEHLCVLVHGLWGNPNHMASIAKHMREKYSEDKLHLLIAKRNAGSFTYDGIELGGERVVTEIEEELEEIERRGGKIKKLSIVGYSLGGLVARYAVGLLFSKGILDQLEPVNFTTFASPHLGVRTPLRGYHNHVWNVLGARTLSESGRQLFTVDKFRDTGRPLLAVMADPKSIFVSGLRKFKRRTLYANCIRDRSAAYYTTCIAKTDPYTDLSRVKVNYLMGYEEVMVDPQHPVTFIAQESSDEGPTFREMSATAYSYVQRVPLALALSVAIPLGVIAYLINAGFQNIKSSKRIKLHEKGLAGIQIDKYRVPLWIQDIRGAVEETYETLNSAQEQEFLHSDDDDVEVDSEGEINKPASEIMALERRQSTPRHPTLALTHHQFEMIKEMDTLGWRKYPVFIHHDRHTHAAIILRYPKKTFSEGLVVMQHWLKEEFLM
ncbi:DUF676-domain-containing protein [Zalerion maritima]|uniref:DUF676-domain-containing protein n=1 Tax=Zalerion maritima TaxID=339359 RepID=A0AAD5RUY0_9PEZI|nr:DUF676-domain-containing protein [Zalerion maritima]